MIRSISARIALPVILVTAAVFAVLAGTALLVARADLREEAGQGATAVVERVAEDLDGRLSMRISALELTARRFAAQFRALDSDGVDDFLSDKVVLATMFSSLLVVSPEGRVLGDWPPVAGRRGLDVTDRPYFQAVRERLRTDVSEPFRARVGGQEIFNISTPVMGADGRLVAILVASTRLLSSDFLGDVRHARIGTNGHNVVVTRSGTIIAHRDDSKVMQTVSSEAERHILARAAAGWTGWEQIVDQGTPMLVAYRSLRFAPWVAESRIPSAEAYAPLRRIQWLILAAALGAMLFLALLIPLVTRRNLAPLHVLRRQIDEVESGRRIGQVDVTGINEIQDVARSFNALLERRDVADAALRESEGFHRALADHAPQAILMLGPDGTCTYANHEWVRMTGHPQGLTIGQPWLEFVATADRIAAASIWTRLSHSGQPIDAELRLVQADLANVLARVRLAPIRESNAQQGYLASIEDIGSQRKAHQRLVEEIARADTMLLAMRDAIVLVSGNGRIDRLNQAATALLGWDESALNLPLSSVLHLYRDDDGSRVPVETITALTKTESDEWSCETPSFGRIPVEVRWYRIDASEALAESGLEVDGGGVLLVRDVAERRQHSRKIAWEAMHDSLTGLANRRAFEEALGHAFSRFKREGMSSSVLAIDLDRFKQVNDRAGHAAGDEVLERVADVIRSSLRSSDLPARIGGDEFTVLLTGCDIERAARIATIIRQGIEAIRVQAHGESLAVGASVGVATMLTDDERVQEVLTRADVACYTEKAGHASGREFIETLRQRSLPGAASADLRTPPTSKPGADLQVHRPH